jgi:hypothetical protein
VPLEAPEGVAEGDCSVPLLDEDVLDEDVLEEAVEAWVVELVVEVLVCPG